MSLATTCLVWPYFNIPFGWSHKSGTVWLYFINFSFIISDNNTNTLSEDCQDLLKRFVEIIHNCIKALLQGSILITDLIKLSNNREIFQKTIIAMKCENIEIIMKILPIRKMEFEAFEKAYQIVQNFTYVSIHCKGIFLINHCF